MRGARALHILRCIVCRRKKLPLVIVYSCDACRARPAAPHPAVNLPRLFSIPDYAMRRLAILTLLLSASAAFAQPAQPLTMQQIMADPDWIGPTIEQAWWSWDGKRAYGSRKRAGATIRDIYMHPVDGGAAVRLDGAARGDIDGQQPVFDARTCAWRSCECGVRARRVATVRRPATPPMPTRRKAGGREVRWCGAAGRTVPPGPR